MHDLEILNDLEMLKYVFTIGFTRLFTRDSM